MVSFCTGLAFVHVGKTYWSRDLCLADSDADGFRNGEELGDPCCMPAVATPSPSIENIS